MKKIFLLLSFLLFITCAKEDSESPNNITSQIIKQYTLTVSAGDGGSVSTTGGNFASGTQVSITATPNVGYSFSGWSNGSTVNPLNLTLNSNTNITANFQVILNSYTLTVSAGEGGSVSIEGGEYEEGSQVTIQANPNEGYTFLSWSNGSTDNPIILNIDSDINIEVTFENILESYREEVLNKINALEDYISQIETKSEILSPYNSLKDEISNNSESIEIIDDKYQQFINDEFKPKYLIYLGIEDGYYIELQSNRYFRDSREELSNIENEYDDLIPRQITINNDYIPDFCEPYACANRMVVKVQNGKIIEDWKISTASGYWYNTSPNDLVKERYYWSSRDYTYEHILGEKSREWDNQEDTFGDLSNDSLAYHSHYKIVDYGIFRADIISSIQNSLDLNEGHTLRRNYFYKLNSEDVIINDEINFESSVINQTIPFEQINGVYDYYSNQEMFSDPIYANIDNYDPYSFLEAFILDGQRNGYEFKHSLEYYKQNIDIKYVYNAFGTITGKATLCSFENVGTGSGWVKILHSFFARTPITDKQRSLLRLYYHEFGHAILGLAHTCDGGQIMYSAMESNPFCNEAWGNSPASTIQDFKNRVSDMFNLINNHDNCPD